MRVVAGSVYGARSPVPTAVGHAVCRGDAGRRRDDAVRRRYRGARALFIVDGEVDIAGDQFTAGRLLIFRPGDAITVTAVSDARVVLVGGAAMDGPRHIWWNFVSSRKDRIEQAKADWKAGRFDTVPGRRQASSSRCRT